jgi:hypothetical protein
MVHSDVAGPLLNRKRAALVELEGRFGREIRVRGDSQLGPEEIRLHARDQS